MMAVRLRYSFRVNSRKVVSSRMGTLCSGGRGRKGLPDLARQTRCLEEGAAAPCWCAATNQRAELWLCTLHLVCVLHMHKLKASSFRRLRQVARWKRGSLGQVQESPAP